jgi:hypothetical protein
MPVLNEASFQSRGFVQDCSLRVALPGASALSFRESEPYLVFNGVAR